MPHNNHTLGNAYLDGIVNLAMHRLELLGKCIDRINEDFTSATPDQDLFGHAFKVLEPFLARCDGLVVFIVRCAAQKGAAPFGANGLWDHVCLRIRVATRSAVKLCPWADEEDGAEWLADVELGWDLWVRVQDVRQDCQREISACRVAS